VACDETVDNGEAHARPFEFVVGNEPLEDTEDLPVILYVETYPVVLYIVYLVFQS